MMKRGHGQTNQLCDINWGALDHASQIPIIQVCMCKIVSETM